jgi:HSP20 family protein
MAPQPNDSAAWISVFRQYMDEMFNHIFHMRDHGGALHEFSPLVDIYESAGHFVIELDLPGSSENDFCVNVAGSSIRIEGFKRHDKSESAMSYICLERHFGRFSRTIEIPPDFEPGCKKAVYERGVLSVRVPKRCP